MKPINEQFKPEFLAQAKKLAYFTQLLHSILPVECRDHVAVANETESNWQNELRYPGRHAAHQDVAKLA